MSSEHKEDSWDATVMGSVISKFEKIWKVKHTMIVLYELIGVYIIDAYAVFPVDYFMIKSHLFLFLIKL